MTETDSLDKPQSGRVTDGEHRFPVRVFFEDTDLSGIVYHANYLRYMERARSDFLRVLGIDQRAVHEAGEGVYAVRDLAIRYNASARLDDELVVVSRVTKIRAASVLIHQRVMLRDTILTDATVEAAFVSASGRPKRQPAAWVQAFQPLIWKGN